MDGTLLDSAEHHYRAWKETLEEAGFPLSRERFFETFGQRGETILRTNLGEEHPPEFYRQLVEKKRARYRKLVEQEGLRIMPGAREWLSRMRAAGWKQAIASSAPRRSIEAFLASFDLAAFFGAIVGGEDVVACKPDPEVFLLAAERLGVPSSSCVVVEDAPAGIEGAKRASMRSIGLLTSHPRLEADLVAQDLLRLPEDAFAQVLPAH